MPFIKSQNVTKVNRQLRNTFRDFISQEATAEKSMQKIAKALKTHHCLATG